jgi:hypothetical protein
MWFWFAFPLWPGMMSIFPCVFSHLDFFFWKSSVQFICPFLHWVIEFFKRLVFWAPCLYLSYDPEIPVLGIYLKDCEWSYNKGTCTPMFTVTLLTIAVLWKQPRCLTTDKWIKKMWNLYRMEFYWVTKKNKSLSFTGKLMDWRSS